jgi:regulator of replication initiation timing
LQTEGIEVTAEMDFLGQQNIMLDLENKALKQRLESLSQEHLIKRCKYSSLSPGVSLVTF